MLGLREKAESFRKDVQRFTAELSKGAEDLKLSIKTAPSVGASSFRESLEELQIQADGAQEGIAELEAVTLDTISLEELLGHCLAQLKVNSERVKGLESQLEKFGYLAAYTPLSHHRTQRTTEDSAMEIQGPLEVDKLGTPAGLPQRSQSSPGLLDKASNSDSPVQEQMPTLTPSPVPSPHDTESPSLRELQAKYGQVTEDSPAGISKEPLVDLPAKGQQQQRADTGSWVAKKLQEKSSVPTSPVRKMAGLSIRQSSEARSNDENHNSGNSMQANKLSEEDLRPPSTKLLSIQTRSKQPSLTGDTGSAHSYQGNNTPLGKDDIINVRLANGEAPWDMLSLKAAINQAVPGTGEVQKVIQSATFHPQAAAFTSLLHMCAKNKLWEKALEVFDGMKSFHPGVIPNTVHFSSLISACGTAGRWREAMEIFEELKTHAQSHPKCAPNVITYSALMTACCSGGRPDKAHAVFQDMIAQGIKPDHISYSTLIAGYERWGDMETATKLFEEMRRAGLLQKPLGPTSYLEQFSRKIRRSSSNLVEPQDQALNKNAGPRQPWDSFTFDTEPGSPCIAAHFPGTSPIRHASGDIYPQDAPAGLSRESSQDGYGGKPVLNDHYMSTAMLNTQAVSLSPQRTPLPQIRNTHSNASQNLRGTGGSGRYRDIGRSPLSQSYDASQTPAALAPPPGFLPRHLDGALSLDRTASGAKELQHQMGSAEFSHADFLQYPANTHMPNLAGMNSAVAYQMLDALAQHMPTPRPAAPPGPPLHPQSFARPPAATPAPNGAPQIPQVSVEEYNNLPLRFSRQLSLDQMNEAVDYINAVVEGKHKEKRRSSSSSGTEEEGVTPTELASLQFGIQRTTALLNCLLQLQRMRLCMRNEQQIYMLLP